jgi:hypothetical protein
VVARVVELSATDGVGAVGVPEKIGERVGAFPLNAVQSVEERIPLTQEVAVGILESRAQGIVPVVIVPRVVMFAEPAQVERAVFSAFPSQTADLSRVCHVLSHR